jgi:DNA polymerase elongation subunit (family B)
MMSSPKILIFDIETAPNLADVWGLWNNNVGLNQLRQSGHVMSFVAKWLGEDDIFYAESRTKNDKKLIKQLHKFIDEADIVIAHNGKKFDMGWFRARAAVHGLAPPSPVRVIDTLLVSRQQFYFPSNKLEYLLKVFKCTNKLAHKKYPGHTLWTECLKGNDDAWEEMREYNIIDVTALEELYIKMRPWITNHPNMGVYTEGNEHSCSKCGSTKMRKDGFYYTNAGKYQQYQCSEKGCGGWAKGRTNLFEGNKKALLANAVNS